MDTICVDKTFLVLLVFAITVIAVYNYYSLLDKIKLASSRCVNNSHNEMHYENPKDNEMKIIHVDVNTERDNKLPISDVFRKYDHKVLNDPLIAPRRRDDYNDNPSIFYPTLFGTPTRGGPGVFHKVGMLVDINATNTDKFKFLTLVGRPKYVGGSTYEYYATKKDDDNLLKFDLPSIRKELMGDEDIVVNELGKTYKVQIDKTLDWQYDPSIF